MDRTFWKIIQKGNLNYKKPSNLSWENNRLNQLDAITLLELNPKLKSLKNIQSCGVDGVYNQMLKHSTPKLGEAILKWLN